MTVEDEGSTVLKDSHGCVTLFRGMQFHSPHGVFYEYQAAVTACLLRCFLWLPGFGEGRWLAVSERGVGGRILLGRIGVQGAAHPPPRRG